ncbi:MAG TPA: polysaccharide lyase family protein [Verrucomicrobiae bacterium]|nr:polysaccharide lyase family protein [Verrucomicrobiae bacterium]
MKIIRPWAGLALLLSGILPVISDAQNVVLTDNGSTVTLSNGVVSAIINKNSGKCSDMRLAGGNNLLANGGQFYFDANGSVNNGSSVYVNFTGNLYQVATNTPSLVDVAITDTNLTGFRAELHYIMRAGDSGIYVYINWHHGIGDPQAMLEQSRTVLRCDPNIFVRAYSSANKIGQMIPPILLKTNPAIMDATIQLPAASSYTNATGLTQDGYPVYTKYDWCDYMEKHSVEGLTGDTVGLWMLFGSVEYFNGGPTKANLLLHGTDTTPLLLWDFHAQHFGGSKIYKAADESWDKIVGPCFIYINTGANADELWQDAQAKAASEQAAWPYDWMTATNYPVARGAVAGQLHVPGESCSNALLVLAPAGDYWQWQSEGYQFWTRAAADGTFQISKIRPGIYSLLAHVPGIVGEFSISNVVVTADSTNNLGFLDWNPPRREQRLWRIGTPDLSAHEFRWGDQMRQFGLWWRYLAEQGTNDLVYHVGTSAATNWYYAQSVVAMDDGSYFSPNWMVEFVVTNLPPSPAVLTIDMAGSIGGTLLTSVNGSSLSNITLTNDASIYRSATQSGIFRHAELNFDPALLRLGTNVISFTISKPSPWTGTKPVSPGRGVMYDCVQLECGSVLTSAVPQFEETHVTAKNLSFAGSGGFPDATYLVITATNLNLPFENWTAIATNHFDGSGNFVSTTSAVTSAQQFFRILIP